MGIQVQEIQPSNFVKTTTKVCVVFIYGFNSFIEFKNQSLKYKSLVDCGDMIIPMLMLVCFLLFHYKVWFLYCWVLMIMLLILGDSLDGIFICFCEFMISYELETCKFGCSWCIIWWFHLFLRCTCKVFDKMPKEWFSCWYYVL